jgi:hypothetical protein
MQNESYPAAYVVGIVGRTRTPGSLVTGSLYSYLEMHMKSSVRHCGGDDFDSCMETELGGRS